MCLRLDPATTASLLVTPVEEAIRRDAPNGAFWAARPLGVLWTTRVYPRARVRANARGSFFRRSVGRSIDRRVLASGQCASLDRRGLAYGVERAPHLWMYIL